MFIDGSNVENAWVTSVLVATGSTEKRVCIEVQGVLTVVVVSPGCK